MKVLLDTNVVLDVWLAREPYWRDAARLLGSIEKREIEGYVCPTTVTTLHYLGKKILGEKRTRELLASLLQIFKIGGLTSQEFEYALKSKIPDFEDAVIEAVSVGSGVNVIATRNIKDFKLSKVPAKEPSQIWRGEPGAESIQHINREAWWTVDTKEPGPLRLPGTPSPSSAVAAVDFPFVSSSGSQELNMK